MVVVHVVFHYQPEVECIYTLFTGHSRQHKSRILSRKVRLLIDRCKQDPIRLVDAIQIAVHQELNPFFDVFNDTKSCRVDFQLMDFENVDGKLKLFSISTDIQTESVGFLLVNFLFVIQWDYSHIVPIAILRTNSPPDRRLV